MLSVETSTETVAVRRAVRRAMVLGLLALAVLLSGAGVRAWLNAAHAQTVAQRTQDQATPTVLVTSPKPSKALREIALPATLRGRNEAAIYARTNGYIKVWKKDLGDVVRKGDVLAVIDTPEVDQDLSQAQANQEQIKARLGLAQTSLVRWEGLRQRDAVSQQEVDERRAALQQAQADLAASQANVRRLQQLHEFGVITAPFDGVVVRRSAEVGALVSAGSGGTSKPLYDLAQTDRLRLTVSVPQAFAADVQRGKEVGIKLLERPQLPFKGTVTRVSGGIDVATRSLLVEVELPNQHGLLLPGGYVEVSLPLAGTPKALLLPPNALQFRQDGARVAVVGEGGRLSLRAVTLGRDLGRSVEVLAGVKAQDMVVVNPHDTIEEGQRVKTRVLPPEKDKEGKA
ncbi:efflux RND transporter periplasmic adaptor subunit [Aquabacterium sp.]|uniref:efflux RND transporter periplasmic adaptor subunit n=1 Tax=Aquabacterium sp. TaxID=1872578 RepID=UPI0035B208AC